jgi:sulfide:quinone oxidoreductase
MPATPTQLSVLVAGSGPAALETVLALQALAGDRVTIALVSPDEEFAYRPTSVAAPFRGSAQRTYSLSTLAERGVLVTRDAIASVEPWAHRVRLESGASLPYDVLVMATGATAVREAGMVTFRGPGDTEAMNGLLQDLEGGWAERVAFIAPTGVSWTLPLYELALQTAARADDLCLDRVDISLYTHEARPLEVFGPPASELVEGLLAAAGITLVTGVAGPPPDAEIDRRVTVARPAGRSTPGLPADPRGFLPVDADGRVIGVTDVFGAGDGTTSPVKQGGLATQQADAVAEAIAIQAGARIAREPRPWVLRAMLLTGSGAYFLRSQLDAPDATDVSEEPLWWPPSKIAGRHLAPFLDDLDAEAAKGGAPVTLERRMAAGRKPAVRRRAILAAGRDGESPRTVVVAVD